MSHPVPGPVRADAPTSEVETPEVATEHGRPVGSPNSMRNDGVPCAGEMATMSTGRTEKEQARVHIRWMIRRDMPEVLSIETQCFEFPWTEEDFLRCLRQRNCIGMVAEQGEKVVGFM